MSPSRVLKWMFVFTVLAISVRILGVSTEQLQVEHFDEGVYASNLYSPPPGFRYPFQHLYAPPLWPMMLELAQLTAKQQIGGTVFVPTLILSIVLIYVSGWVARGVTKSAWTRAEASQQSAEVKPVGSVDVAFVAAAMLTMLNGLFIMYGRTALTDVPSTLFITVAVGAGIYGLKSGVWLWTLMAGLFTAMAWWTKYNGWLPIAILAAGCIGFLIVRERSRKLTLYSLIHVGLIAALAFTLWLPYLNSLQPLGGYAAVASNHAGYVTGFGNWWSSAFNHLLVDRYYNATFGPVSILFAIVAPYFFCQTLANGNYFSLTSKRFALVALIGVSLAALAYGIGTLPVLILTGLAGTILTLINRKNEVSRLDSIGAWVLLAWICGLLLMTPTYRPYPRLILPLVMPLIIGTSLLISDFYQRLVRWVPADDKFLGQDFRVAANGAIFIAGIVFIPHVLIPMNQNILFESRTQLFDIAQSIDGETTDAAVEPTAETSQLIGVYGEPGIFFHLGIANRNNKERMVIPVATTSLLSGPTPEGVSQVFLVTGPHSGDAAQELAASPSVRLVSTHDYVPSSLVLFDDFPPSVMRARPVQKIQVWTKSE